MLDPIVDAGYALLLEFGLPALFALFVVKGAIIGKPFPTSVFLPGYLVAISASRETVVLAVLVASVGYVLGQLAIYWLAARRGVDAVRALPRVTLTAERLERAEDLFDRYGGAGIFVTNLVPYVGTFLMIPAGIAGYSPGRATFYAFTSTVLNYVLIVWVVLGSVDLLAGL